MQLCIKVNATSPGIVRTDFARALWENPEILEARTAGVYLAAQAGSFTTGQNIVVDGGTTIS